MMVDECDEEDVLSLADRSLRLSVNEGMTDEDSASRAEPERFVQKETRAIAYLKTVVVVVLLVTSVSMGHTGFVELRSREIRRFEDAFSRDADRLIDSFYQQVINIVWVSLTFSLSYSTLDNRLGTPGPQVFLPNFDLFSFGQLRLAQASSMVFAPAIRDTAQLTEWEEYAIIAKDQAGYGDDSFIMNNNNNNDSDWQGQRIEDGVYAFYDDLYPVRVKTLHKGPFFPAWQVSPLPEYRRLVMLDLYSERQRRYALDLMLALRHAVFTPVLDAAFEQRLLRNADDVDPHSILFMPVFVGNNNNKTVGGTVAIDAGWASALRDAVHDAECVMHVVLENTCSQTYTYEVRGHEVLYLGPGDHHQTQFHNNFRTSSWEGMHQHWRARLLKDNSGRFNDYPLGRDDEKTCRYSIRVYPTTEFYASYMTYYPVYAIVVVVVLFVFMGMMFLLYDFFVERRQTMTMDAAVRSNEIVHNLFPKVVRDRLFGLGSGSVAGSLAGSVSSRKKKTTDDDYVVVRRKGDVGDDILSSFHTKRDEFGFFSLGTPKVRLTTFLQERGVAEKADARGEEPIAEMFPNTTVVFADIVGFTAWSSQREPAQVFTLLETLYSAFDVVAKRLGVFKVETIGDCYVAVTGLPTPNKDHAVIMARFAYEILQQMSELTKELEITLGPGTSELGLRIGLHSGPVTAGVLRGEKSRFQLFGDTMNTASRIESTSKPRMIQVSQETANLIMQAGKQHWLTPRQGLVMAKGKGEMQTYFLQPTRRRIIISYDAKYGDGDVENLNNPDDAKAAVAQNNASVSASTPAGSSSSNLGPPEVVVENIPSTLLMNNKTPSTASGMTSSMAQLELDDKSNTVATDDRNQWALLNLEHNDSSDRSDKFERLIDWNVEILLVHLDKVVMNRNKLQTGNSILLHKFKGANSNNSNNATNHSTRVTSGVASSVGSNSTGINGGSIVSRGGASSSEAFQVREDSQFLSEVSEIIELPKFEPPRRSTRHITRRWNYTKYSSLAGGHIGQEVKAQLRDFVSRIASMYQDVPFHNFEHASHVTMSANKLMKRIILAAAGPRYKKTRSNSNNAKKKKEEEEFQSNLHYSTFGISSDPLTQFVVVLAALVHDVDHTGVPNAQLVKEHNHVAIKFRNKSVAEQHSVDIALRTLAEPQYKDLLDCICATEAEQQRFRQLLINAVMATDIADMELQQLRKKRWNKAFHNNEQVDELVNRKATIVIEHIIQASDVAHTMQHWHVFCKWNERLFQEMHVAYESGRAVSDPSEGWYEGQLAFFDKYVIPLAKKLKECGVFGVSSDEYLAYALENRREWEQKGEEESKMMIMRLPHNKAQMLMTSSSTVTEV